MKIVDRIFQTMQDKQLKASDMAKYIGTKPQIVSAWKSRQTNPPVQYIKPIADFLNVSTEYILTGRDENFSQEERDIISAYRAAGEGRKEAVRDLLHVDCTDEEEQEMSSSSRTG